MAFRLLYKPDDATAASPVFSSNSTGYRFPEDLSRASIEISIGDNYWKIPLTGIDVQNNFRSGSNPEIDSLAFSYKSGVTSFLEEQEEFLFPSQANPAPGFPFGNHEIYILFGGYFSDRGHADLLDTTELPTSPSQINFKKDQPPYEYFGVIQSSTGDGGSIAGGSSVIDFRIDPQSLSFREINTTPDVPQPLLEEPAELVLGAPNLPSFDRNRSTVVIVHGRQPDVAFTGRREDVSFLNETFEAINLEYGDEVNIVWYSWSGAFTGDDTTPYPTEPKPFIDEAGRNLGVELARLLGDDYNRNLHVIGHSYGSIVGAVSLEELASRGVDPAQVHLTILDAPVCLACPVSPLRFLPARTGGFIDYIDNYYGTGLNFVDVGGVGFALPPFSRPIHLTAPENPGDIRGGGLALEGRDHEGVWQAYAESVGLFGTIPDAELGEDGFPRPGGFYQSAALGRLDGYFSVSGLGSEFPISFSTISEDAILSVVAATRTTLLEDDQRAIISTGSNGYVTYAVTIPSMFEFMLFDLQFLSPGDGDWLEVQFDGNLLGSFRGEVYGTDWREIVLDIGPFSGREGLLTFLLVGVGEDQARVDVGNIRFSRFELGSPAPVPIPASVGFLLLAIGALAFARRRRVT